MADVPTIQQQARQRSFWYGLVLMVAFLVICFALLYLLIFYVPPHTQVVPVASRLYPPDYGVLV